MLACLIAVCSFAGAILFAAITPAFRGGLFGTFILVIPLAALLAGLLLGLYRLLVTRSLRPALELFLALVLLGGLLYVMPRP
jgi:hypothetical protein